MHATPFRRLLAVTISILSAGALHAARPASITPDAMQAADKAAPKPGLKKFLHSTKGTYGWAPVKGTISYDFFPDGRLHIQGPDGEATMREGKWSLNGDQLTLVNTTEKKTSTVTAAIDGEDLLLDGKRYRRFKAE